MFKLSTEELQKIGAEITTREIAQQPELWEETLNIYKENQEAVTNFLNKVKESANGKVRIVFTGAGTSQYVGDTLVPYLNAKGDTDSFIFQSIGTTDIVASPRDYLFEDDTTVIVSFARSGNSPESLATVAIADQVIKNVFHLTVTCAKDGALAKAAVGDERNLLLLMPERSNDGGFAMTGSYSCMTLTGLLVFDQTSIEEKTTYVNALQELGKDVLEHESDIQAIMDLDFNRIVYLGSGSLSGLTREAQLKVLELTAGKITTVYDSSMGFRHGPKSFVNEKTLVFGFVNNNPYTRQYDIDILDEIASNDIAVATVAITQPGEINYGGDKFEFKSNTVLLPEGYLALADVVFAQTVSLLSSIKVGNKPDTPSPTGTVNRVVKGVIIHEFE